MTFAFVYLACLVLPGYLIAKLIRITHPPLLFFVSLSLFYFVFVLLIAFVLARDVATIIYCYAGGVMVLSVVAMTFGGQIGHKNFALKSGYVVVGIASGLYLTYAGLYDEVPSDIYIHLEYFQIVSERLINGDIPALSGSELVSKQAFYWYYLPNFIAYALHENIIQKIEIFAAINTVVLLLCLYEFSHWLFKSKAGSSSELLIISALSVFFFVMHFGINVFSFVRYYAVAPTMLNFAVYLASVVCLSGYIKHDIRFATLLITSALLFLTAYILHAQEALFMLIIYLLLLTIAVAKYRLIPQSVQCRQHVTKPPKYLSICFIGFVISTIAAYYFVVTEIPYSRISKPKIIDLAEILGLGEDIFILNPSFQFYTVLTHWGLYIYLLYITLYKRFFSGNPYLLACMLIPLLTVFNPVFTNFFLRIGYSDVLWRFLYMLPLHFVAARVVAGMFFNRPGSIRSTILGILTITPIFVLLFPLKSGFVDLPYSRIHSLAPVHYQAKPTYWQDMLDYLQNLADTETIITDPVTGYLIKSTTRHRNQGYKFYTANLQTPYRFETYEDHPLKRYNGQLFILNLRKGMSTRTAKVSQHWNPHSLRLTDYYNEALISHLHEEAHHFQLLWQADNIEIYRINY